MKSLNTYSVIGLVFAFLWSGCSRENKSQPYLTVTPVKDGAGRIALSVVLRNTNYLRSIELSGDELPPHGMCVALASAVNGLVKCQDPELWNRVGDGPVYVVRLSPGETWTNQLSLERDFFYTNTANLTNPAHILMWSFRLRQFKGETWDRISGTAVLNKDTP